MPTACSGKLPREMPEATYQWLRRTHAFFAGLKHLQRHWGGVQTTIRWVRDHGYSQGAAEVEAMDVLELFTELHRPTETV